MVTAIREDHSREISTLINMPESDYVQRLSLSEWNLMTSYHGDDSLVRVPVTMHDVFVQGKITIKTGNPYMNNAWEEFYNALRARYLGIVEAKSPIGFSFWLDDIYGERKPGKVFYKHLTGMDLEEAIRKNDASLLNWALWEAGKFLSRLIHAHLYLFDSERLGNYLIESSSAVRVFRFLDMEKMYYLPKYSDEKKVKMLTGFIQKASHVGFLSPEKMSEFIIVCSGGSDRLASLVKKTLGL